MDKINLVSSVLDVLNWDTFWRCHFMLKYWL
jgi:hypothetical protein